MLRISPGLHAALRAAALGTGVSLNEYCARKLAATDPGVPDAALEAVERATEIFGKDLLGVLLYGSWARDELSAGSDVDLLVVLDSGVAITRELYRTWDTSPIAWGAHAIEPHFVHPPEPHGRISGTWAEAAVEGVVAFERTGELSRLLVAVRRRILAGKLVRRRAQGQPYWVEASL